MLNIFPGLLNFTFYAPTIIRIAAGLVFAYVGYMQWERRGSIAKVSWPIIGKAPWAIWIMVLYAAVVALGLILGLYTQIAALLGILGTVKFYILDHRYEEALIISRPTIVLLFFICCSLMLSGAGAIAFDVPL